MTINATGEIIKLYGQGDGNGSGVESIQFSDTTWDSAKIINVLASIPNPVIGTSTAESLSGTSGIDMIQGNGGADNLYGGAGSDTYVWNLGDGSDTINDYSCASDVDVLQLNGVASSGVTITKSGSNAILNIDATGEQITLYGQGGGSGYGVERIQFSDTTWDSAKIASVFASAKIIIAGTSVSESLFGTTGADIFQGNGGADKFYGNSGSDTYIWNLGDGSDTISEPGSGSSSSDIDVLQLNGVASNDVTLSKSGLDAILTINATGEKITLYYQVSGSGSGVERIQFSDTSWDAAKIASMLAPLPSIIVGTSASETLNGSSSADIIQGNGGADIFYGSAGSDTYIWKLGDGSDTIKEYSSATDVDVLQLNGVSSSGVTITKLGSDAFLTINATGEKITLYGQGSGSGCGLERIQFSDASWDAAKIAAMLAATPSKVIGSYASENLSGSSYADILQGNGGDDTLSGSSGSDTYIWNLGDGSDTISEYSYASDVDVLQLNGVASTGVTVTKSGQDAFLTINATGEKIRLRNQRSGSGYGVERIQFSDASWDSAKIADMLASAVNLMGGTWAADNLYGTSGVDIIQGNGGADELDGGAGSDTYIWNLGDGSDTIREYGHASDIDVLQLNGVSSSDVTVSRSGSNAILTINATGEQITLYGQGSGSGSGYGVERIQFSDASWDAAKIANVIDSIRTYVTGTSAADNLNGTSGADIIQGNGGADIFYGSAGSDTYIWNLGDGSDTIKEYSSATDVDVLKLNGVSSSGATLTKLGLDAILTINASGEKILLLQQASGSGYGVEAIQFSDISWDGTQITNMFAAMPSSAIGTSASETLSGSSYADIIQGNGGDDILDGGDGSDTYIWNLGDGCDSVYDMYTSSSDADVLQLNGVASTGVTVAKLGADVVLIVNATGERIRLDTQNFIAGLGVERIQFSDASWDAAKIASMIAAAPELFVGTSSLDSLVGSTGADIFQGAGGDDHLRGFGGDDIFMFNAGFGRDTITDFAVGDKIQLDHTLIGDWSSLLQATKQVGSDTVISVSTTDTITLEGVLASSLTSQQFTFV